MRQMLRQLPIRHVIEPINLGLELNLHPMRGDALVGSDGR
jgi:hypothetical protein